jgi:hypothetical protein
MTYATPASSDALGLELSPVTRRERNANLGYLLFAFGGLWVIAVAVAMAASPTSILECQLATLGDVAFCGSQSVGSAPPTAGSNVRTMVIQASLPVAD